MARSRDDREPHDPQDRPVTPANPPPPTPAGPLTADEQGRLRELREKAKTGISDEENTELTELEARVRAVNQQLLSPDRPVEHPGALPRDDANRLRDLRVAHQTGTLSDADREEMARLSSAESDAAGHVAPEAARDERDDGSWVIYEILSMIEGVIDRVPAIGDMRPRLTSLRNRLDATRQPDRDLPENNR